MARLPGAVDLFEAGILVGLSRGADNRLRRDSARSPLPR